MICHLSIIRPPNEMACALQTIKYLQKRGLPANLILRYLKVRFPFLYPHNPVIPMVEIHIGNLIRQQMEAENITPTDMAQKLGLQRPNLYRILRSTTMNTALLYRISEVLHYDFFAVYSSSLKHKTKKNNKNDTPLVTNAESNNIV